MSERELQETLRALHRELEATQEIHGDTQEALREALAEIAALMERSDEGDRDLPGGLVERLEQAAALFEAEHPRIAGTISRVLDSLAKLGF